jgi:hypothetical protein
MKEIFSKSIYAHGSFREFEFRRVFYSLELWYHIGYINTDDNNKIEQFRLYRDENNQWKIAAQILPNWIHEKELEFGDLIDENEST